MEYRVYLDDINQSWVTTDSESGIISCNTYEKSLWGNGINRSMEAYCNARSYWKDRDTGQDYNVND